jgi:hypothetical protein
MSTTRVAKSIFVPSVEEVPRISDAERAELLASLDESRAAIAAGDFDVLTPGKLRMEFEASLEGDPSDEELDALLGISPSPSD